LSAGRERVQIASPGVNPSRQFVSGQLPGADGSSFPIGSRAAIPPAAPQATRIRSRFSGIFTHW